MPKNTRLGRICIKCSKRYIPNGKFQTICDNCQRKIYMESQNWRVKPRGKIITCPFKQGKYCDNKQNQNRRCKFKDPASCSYYQNHLNNLGIAKNV